MLKESAHDGKDVSNETGQVGVTPLWMAGLIEVGAATVALEKSESAYTPVITFSGLRKHVDRVERYFSEFGVGRRDKPREFTLQGEEAKSILRNIPPELTPTKAKSIQAALAGDLDSLNIAAEQELHILEGKENPYIKLVKHPDFLAGVIDGHGGIYFIGHSQKHQMHAPALTISSKNFSLLQAIADCYGSTVRHSKNNEHRGVISYYYRPKMEQFKATLAALRVKKEEGQEVFRHDREKTPQEEDAEAFAQKHAKYLAGYFTQRGSFMYRTELKRHTYGLTPGIRVTGSQEEMEALGNMLSLLSPTVWKLGTKDDGRYALLISNRNALIVMKAMDQYFFRDSAVTLMAREWDDLSVAQRIARWEELRQTPSAEKDFDATLLRDPQWLAGFLDARSSFTLDHRSRVDRQQRFPRISVSSVNPKLLDQLCELYGGEKPYQRHGKNSYEWRIVGSDARHLYNFVRPNLMIQRQKAEDLFGWSEPEFIANLVLDQAMRTPDKPLTAAILIERVKRALMHMDSESSLARRISVDEVNVCLRQLLRDRRLTVENEAEPRYKPTFDARNIDAIERSPIALQEVLRKGLREGNKLIIAQTGKIIGVYDVAEGMTWFVPDDEVKAIRDQINARNAYLRSQNRSEAIFLQFNANGIVVDYVANLRMLNLSELTAVKEAIVSALEESITLYIQVNEAFPQGIGELEQTVKDIISGNSSLRRSGWTNTTQ